MEVAMVFPMKLNRLLATVLFLLCFVYLEGSARAAYTLTTVPDPRQGGLVSPNCSAGCLYAGGAVVKLFALPFYGYIFGNWSGDCAGSNPETFVTMGADRSCTAGFTDCGGQPVEIGSTGYSGLMAAYAVADDGDSIEMLATNLPESPNLDLPVSVTIKGGYGCGFGSNPSMTHLMGPLTISKGTVTVENLIIVGPLSAATAIPPAIPTLPDATGFDNIINNPAVTGNATQNATGTTGSDRITQYGGTGTVVQTASGDAGNDWILQVCGGTSCDQTAHTGDGIDTVYQYGGPGSTSQYIDGITGSKTYVQVGGASPNTQIAFGSTGIDRIFQYGGAANDLMSAEGAESDDRIEQYGGDGDDSMVAEMGSGNDYIYQDGGAGRNNLLASGGSGDDRVVQKGGAGADSMNCIGAEGNDSIQIVGGGGDDAIRANGGGGNDTVAIDAGPGNDTITYDVTVGTDTAFIDGGTGTDTLTVIPDGLPFVIQDNNANVIHKYGIGGTTITLKNMEFLIAYGDTGEHVSDNVSFTLTFASGSFNSVPAGADKVTISIDSAADTRVYRLTPELGSAANPLRVSFVAVAGNHTYTAKAWSGSTLLGTIGPISFTTVSGFPLTIPLAFSFPAFDSYHTDVGTAGPNSQIFFGTAGRDRVVQYGGAANDLQSVDAGAGNDWVEQYSGDGDDTMVADMGTGDDYVYQDGGAGRNNLAVVAGSGDDRVVQKGGAEADSINCLGGEDNDKIDQVGGDGDDKIRASPSEGNDSVAIDAGPGNDTITYDLGTGTDTVSIDGGTGADTLIINRNNVMDYTIKNAAGMVLFSSGTGGTTITVFNVEHITVLDEHGNILFSWNAP
jgi:Ca2+-binding RTX toxin-like protein